MPETHLEIERKFLLKNWDPLTMVPPGARIEEITQTYLLSKHPSIERRVRAIQVGRNVEYFYTEKGSEIRPGMREEMGENVTRELYMEYLEKDWDHDTVTIRKTRFNIPYRGFKLQVDIYDEPTKHEGLVICEVELPRYGEEFALPSHWMAEEVTGIRKYQNRSLAGGD